MIFPFAEYMNKKENSPLKDIDFSLSISLSQICLLHGFLLVLLLFPSLITTTSRREVITSRHGAVATDDGRSSLIGRNVLREGGHVVDATVSATLCLGVVSPASSGIGGGAFMVFRSANGKAQAFNMRESAPMLTSQETTFTSP
ncbi:glutathione hydrolase 2-like [Apium graveolens]|uniref:glutathione hydrolase 2-like n=1 Tax=Apium graveolens TaxID=4045 RepID=UPI003D7AEF8F